MSVEKPLMNPQRTTLHCRKQENRAEQGGADPGDERLRGPPEMVTPPLDEEQQGPSLCGMPDEG